MQYNTLFATFASKYKKAVLSQGDRGMSQ